jgi:hypothetical protein
MRRLIGVLALLVICACPSSALAAQSDIARGAGEVGPIAPSKFRFAARSGPLGEDPSGTMSLQTNAFTVEARVTCLAVLGNVAGMLGDVTRAEGIPAETLEFRVQDNGPHQPDGFSYAVHPTNDPPLPGGVFCAPIPPPPAQVLVRGNILVRDAVP